MYISKYNHEGYPSPTEYEALTNISKENPKRYMPMVYICSPYSGDITLNVENARKYSRFAYELDCIPIAPHLLLPQFMDDMDKEERDDALFMDLAILSHCKELWVFGAYHSPGMQKEIAYAKRKHKCIRYFTETLKEEMR